MEKYIFRRIDLQLFADGGDGGAAADAGGETGVTAAGAGPQSGVTDPGAADQQHEDKPIDKKAAFAALVGKDGEYKAEYDAAVKDLVDKRTKGTRKMVERYAPFEPIVQALGAKYGVDPSDTGALLRAINGDQQELRRQAIEGDMSEEAASLLNSLRQENASLKAQQEVESIDRYYSSLVEQEKETKAMFPDFNLEQEMSTNEEFARLMRSGRVSMKAALIATNWQKYRDAEVSSAVKAAEKRVADTVAAGVGRPAENGLNSASPTPAKVDAAKLSPKQRDAFNARIKQGERLTLADFLAGR